MEIIVEIIVAGLLRGLLGGVGWLVRKYLHYVITGTDLKKKHTPAYYKGAIDIEDFKNIGVGVGTVSILLFIAVALV